MRNNCLELITSCLEQKLSSVEKFTKFAYLVHLGAMKVKPGTEKTVGGVLKDDTFGDMERKLVKQFREDHNSVE